MFLSTPSRTALGNFHPSNAASGEHPVASVTSSNLMHYKWSYSPFASCSPCVRRGPFPFRSQCRLTARLLHVKCRPDPHRGLTVRWSLEGLLTTQFAPRHSPELGSKSPKHDTAIRQTNWFCENRNVRLRVTYQAACMRWLRVQSRLYSITKSAPGHFTDDVRWKPDANSC